ncbi:MAG: tetratricopeptide repeat protein [Janthinobacterium lividum]
MKRPAPAQGRLQLVSTPVLLFAALFAAAVFLALFPSERVLRDIAEKRKTDVLSLAYLRLLLRTHPADAAVSLALARAYVQVGEWNQARAILLPLAVDTNADASGRDARLALLELAWQFHGSLPPGDIRRAASSKDLAEALERLAQEPLPTQAVQRLAALSTALDLPALSARLYQRLAQLEPGNAGIWLERMAETRLASGDPAQAAGIFAALSLRTGEFAAARLRQADRALELYLASGDGPAGLAYAGRLLDESAGSEFASSPILLQRAIAIARAHDGGPRAQAWGRRLLALHPDDVTQLSRQLELELSMQALPAALALARRLVELAPDVQRRSQLAQIAVWSDQQALALQQYTLLARQNPGGAAMSQALLYADARTEDVLWLELANRAVAYRALSPAEEMFALNVAQRGKAPRALAAFLSTYLARQPAPLGSAGNAGAPASAGQPATLAGTAIAPALTTRRQLWMALARTQQTLGDKQAALATWQRAAASGAQGFDLVELALQQARLLQELLRVDEAAQQIDAVRGQAAADDIAFWALAGELAWKQKRLPVALAAYRRAWDGATAVSAADPAAAMQAQVAERLIAGYQQNHDVPAAIDITRQAYGRLGEPRWLLLGMDAAAGAGRWGDLRALLKQAEPAAERFESADMYWFLYASSASHESQPALARSAYEKILARHPDSRQAQLGLLWLDIDHRTAQLAADLVRWQDSAALDRDYWPVYAAGYESLQRHAEALPWLALQAKTQQGDALWSLHHAEVMAKAGRIDAAQQLRYSVFVDLRKRFADIGMMSVAVKSAAGTSSGTDRTVAIAYSKLALEFAGAAASDQVLQQLLDNGADDADVHEMLVASALDGKNPALARQRLQRAQAHQHRLPVWQSMAVAMADADKREIASILAISDANARAAMAGAEISTAQAQGGNAAAPTPATGSLTPTDRVEAMRILGLHADALRYADTMLLRDENAGNALLRRQRESLAEQQATRVRAGAGERRIAGLQLGLQEAQVSIALDPARLTLRAARTRLSSKDGQLSLAGIDIERDFSASLELTPDATTPLTRLTLGTLQRSDNSPLYGRFEWARRLDPRAVLHVDASFNMASEETAALRVVGMKDKLSTGLAVDLTERSYARADIAAQRYRTRAADQLAQGYRISGEIGTTVLREAPFWQVRVSGSWEKNHLAETLPASLLGSRLQAASTVGDVVAERFGLIALGSTLRFGDPDAALGKPYTLADLFVGREWPAQRNAYGGRLVFALPISAPDELRLEVFYSNAQRGVAAQASRGVGLSYLRAF